MTISPTDITMFKTISLVFVFCILIIPSMLKGQCQSTAEAISWWSEFNTTKLSNSHCDEGYFSGAKTISRAKVSNPLTITTIKKKGRVLRLTDDLEYVVVDPGTEVLVTGTRGNEKCLRTPDNDYAWAKDSDFEMILASSEAESDWLGSWAREKSSINISLKDSGSYEVEGKNFWYSRREPYKDNDFVSEAKPVKCTLYSGQPGTRMCRIVYRQMGNHLVVKDNGRCGGPDVRISGVYNRQ